MSEKATPKKKKEKIEVKHKQNLGNTTTIAELKSSERPKLSQSIENLCEPNDN